MVGANSINETTIGICGFTGTSFVGTPVTQFNIISGGATSSTLNNIAPSATSGVPLISQGAASQPVFGTAVVAGGGTGRTTLTNHGVLVGAGTAAITQLATGSAGQVLQSGGAGADPAYSTATYPSTAGTSGNVLTSDGTNWLSAAPPGGGVLVASGSLTNAQIKALHATPVQIIAAPGSGNVIMLLQGIITMNYGGTNAFTAGAAQTINAFYGTTIGAILLMSNAAIVATQSTVNQNASTLSGNLALASASNTAINLYNPVVTEIAGNAANNNTMSYNITYRIITIP